jgi:hypothetical protein
MIQLDTRVINSSSKNNSIMLYETQSQNLSINQENDSMSAILNTKNSNRTIERDAQFKKMLHDSSDLSKYFRDQDICSLRKVSFDRKTHFSPQTSVKIRVIDETDTDY